MHVTETTALSSSGCVQVKIECDESATTTATTTPTSHTITTTTNDGATTSVTPVNGTVNVTSVNGSVHVNGVVSAANVNGTLGTTYVNSSVSVSSVLSSLDSNARKAISELQCKVEAELDGDSNCSSSSCVDSLASIGCWGMPMEEESDASMRKRLFTSLSQSFPDSALSRMLHSMDTMPLDSDDEDLASPDKLSSSCFAQIRLDKGEIEDDELTSLAWLQDSDLLKNMNAGEKEGDGEAEEQKENDEGRKNVENGSANFVPQTHPPHVPYNPLKHVNSKPPYSFSCLIFMAVEDSPQKKLPVKDIYNWILTHFPYFQNAPTGWKNSVRHNLSLNKCFKKVEKDKGQSIGKGSLWCIDPDYRPNLLQALRKTPYHPYHQLQMMSTMPQTQHIHHVHHALPGGFRAMPLTQRPVPNTVSPHLFPFLSRRLAQTQCDFDSEMQDVANTLVAMKGFSSKNSSGMSSDGSDDSGPNSAGAMFKRKFGYGAPHRRHNGPIICTLNPSEDHTYSATRVREEDDASGTSSIDNEYDFGSGDEEEEDDISEPSECPSDWDCESDGDEVDGEVPPIMPRKRLKIDLNRTTQEDEDDEEMKKEGAKALLNLAGFFRTHNSNNEAYNKPSPRKSPSTPSSSASKSHSRSATAASSSPSSSSLSPSSLKVRSSLKSTSSGKLRKSWTPPPSSSISTASLSSNSAPSSSSKSTLKSLASKPSPKLSASWAGSTKPTLKASASPSLSSSTSSLTIMTRRGRAAAEAAAAAENRVRTRGKKIILPSNS